MKLKEKSLLEKENQKYSRPYFALCPVAQTTEDEEVELEDSTSFKRISNSVESYCFPTENLSTQAQCVSDPERGSDSSTRQANRAAGTREITVQ